MILPRHLRVTGRASPSSIRAAAADLDDDGKIDIVAGDEQTGLFFPQRR